MKRARDEVASLLLMPAAKVPRMELSCLITSLPPELYIMLLPPLALIARIALRRTCTALYAIDLLEDDDIKDARAYAQWNYDRLRRDTACFVHGETRTDFVRWAMTFGIRWLERMDVCWEPETVWWDITAGTTAVQIKLVHKTRGIWAFDMNGYNTSPSNPSYTCRFIHPEVVHHGMLSFGCIHPDPDVVK